MERVFLADDHAMVRAGVRSTLQSISGFECVGEACNAEAMFEGIDEHHPTLLILDISMPPSSEGIELVAKVHKDFPALKILVFTLYSEDMYAVRALRLGARGYISKGCTAQELIDAITRVAADKRFVSDQIASKIMNSLGEDMSLPHEKLSKREKEVMTRILAGKSLSAISDELCISIKTVSTHRMHILSKMNLANTIELAAYGIAYGLVNIKY